MRLWGRVARGLLLVMVVLFTVIAVVSPEMRRQAIVAVVVSAAVALLGVPAIVRLFSAFTGDEEVLENGTPGTATITSLQATRLRFNRTYPVVRFGLNVEAAGVYPVEIKQAVDPHMLARLAPGVVVGVRVDRQDRKKVVIDWREPVRTAAGATVDPNVAATEQPAMARRSLWPFLRWACLLFGLVFFRLGCEEGYYEKGGVRVQGVVLQKTYSPGTSSTSGRRGSPARRTVSYRFTTKEGRTVEGRTDVLPETWASLSEGDAVAVEYLQESPDTNRIPDQRARSMIWGVMALVLLGTSAVLFVVGWRRRAAASVAGTLLVVVATVNGAAGVAEPFKTLDQYRPRDATAVIKAVSLSASDQQRFNPQAVGTEFRASTTHVVVWYRWEGALPGHRLDVHWVHEGTKVLEQGEQVTKHAGAEAWVLKTTNGPAW